jgi:hypothetical protein
MVWVVMIFFGIFDCLTELFLLIIFRDFLFQIFGLLLGWLRDFSGSLVASEGLFAEFLLFQAA